MKHCKQLFVLIGLLSLLHANGQQPVRKFPAPINHPTIDAFAPFISLDGSAMVFSTYYGLEKEVITYYSQHIGGDWTQPVELPKSMGKLTMSGSYTLSPDGNTLYITSVKSNGVGRYDIWYSQLKGSTWGEPVNMFAPVNSKLNDGTPTFTPDGKTMYFMRCEQMTQQSASGCKIMMTKLDNLGKWQEPVELPANINSGNSQTPRIMADGETLVFASDKLQPGKGGMDLYYSKFIDNKWQDPVAMDFANTEGNDQFVSVMSSGRYLTMDKPERKRQIVDVLIPEEIRPRAVMKVTGTVLDESDKPTPAYISVIDEAGKRFYSGRPDSKDGSFFLYLTEGDKYELAVDHELGNHTYYTKTYDLTSGTVPTFDKVNITLKELKADDEWDLDGFEFKPLTAQLNVQPNELRRLIRLLRSSNLNYEIQVMLVGYKEDSVKSSPDLTETVIDSALYQVESMDSMGVTNTYDSLVVNTTYHNDRTKKQAEAIVDKLVGEGIDRSRLSYFVNTRPAVAPEENKLLLRIAARKPN